MGYSHTCFFAYVLFAGPSEAFRSYDLCFKSGSWVFGLERLGFL